MPNHILSIDGVPIADIEAAPFIEHLQRLAAGSGGGRLACQPTIQLDAPRMEKHAAGEGLVETRSTQRCTVTIDLVFHIETIWGVIRE